MEAHQHQYFDNWPRENYCHICGKGERTVFAEKRMAKLRPVLAALSGVSDELSFYGADA